jgi:hypothetical protein
MQKAIPLAKQIKQALEAAGKPLTFEEIEAAVGKRPDFRIGIALGQLAVRGEIRRHADRFSELCPVYWFGKLPVGFIRKHRDN